MRTAFRAAMAVALLSMMVFVPSISADDTTWIEIHTLEDLDSVRDDLAGNYRLMADIDASATTTWRGGLGWESIGSYQDPFTGCLDGNGHVISGLYKNASEKGGLFVKVTGSIMRLGLEDAWIRSQDASILATWISGTVENCYVAGHVIDIGTAPPAIPTSGGMVDILNDGTMVNCYAAVTGEGANFGALTTPAFSFPSEDSYYDSDMEADSGAGVSKNTSEMMRQATFSNWDFDEVWTIQEDVDYPKLRPGTTNDTLQNGLDGEAVTFFAALFAAVLVVIAFYNRHPLLIMAALVVGCYTILRLFGGA